MSAILDFQNRIQTITCSGCGVVYGLPYGFIDNQLQDKQIFYCPNGHSQQYIKSEADKLREQLVQEKAATEWQKARANRLEKDLQVQKGQATKLRNRLAKGVCPCCKRSFTVLSRHMKTKHPDYVEGVIE